MSEKEVMKKYKEFWAPIVENKDGTLNKKKVARELYDFSTIIHNCAKLYCLASGNRASNPMTKPEVVFQLFEDQLTEAYERGYQEATEDLK